MFVLVSVGYLAKTSLSSVSSATISIILEKMISAAEAISHHQRCRDVHGCEDAEDRAWAAQLHYRRGELSEIYAPLFRQLLHIFERSHTRGILTGDQDDIRRLLHGNLDAAHKERTCEMAECPWTSHQCPGTWDSYCRECPLLVTGEDVTFEPASPLSGAHADDGETCAPAPSAGAGIQHLWPAASGAPVAAQSTVPPGRPLGSASVSPTSAIRYAQEYPLSSIHPTQVGANESPAQRTASLTYPDDVPQPRILPDTSPESRPTTVQIPSPVRSSSSQEDGPYKQPSDSGATRSPDGEAHESLLMRESSGDKPVAAEPSTSVAAEAPAQRSDVLGETDARGVVNEDPMNCSSPPQVLAPSDAPPSASLYEGSRHSASPMRVCTVAPGQIAVCDGRQKSASSHRPPPEKYSAADEDAHREERALDDQQAEGRTGRAAADLFHGSVVASGQGTEEFELVTRGVYDVSGAEHSS